METLLVTMRKRSRNTPCGHAVETTGSYVTCFAAFVALRPRRRRRHHLLLLLQHEGGRVDVDRFARSPRRGFLLRPRRRRRRYQRPMVRWLPMKLHLEWRIRRILPLSVRKVLLIRRRIGMVRIVMPSVVGVVTWRVVAQMLRMRMITVTETRMSVQQWRSRQTPVPIGATRIISGAITQRTSSLRRLLRVLVRDETGIR